MSRIDPARPGVGPAATGCWPCLPLRRRGPARGAFSLVEVLLSALLLALLGVAIYSVMVSSVRGVASDRVSESIRHVTLDLLERFAHPDTDLASLVPASSAPVVTCRLQVGEALRLLALPVDAIPPLEATLTGGGVTGFTLAWKRGVATGRGDPARALRFDTVWCTPVIESDRMLPNVMAFRSFQVRGQ